MLGQLYQDSYLYQCLCEEIRIKPERLFLLHQLVMNYDRMSAQEIKERVFRYGAMIEDGELFARQMFLCLLRLADSAENRE